MAFLVRSAVMSQKSGASGAPKLRLAFTSSSYAANEVIGRAWLTLNDSKHAWNRKSRTSSGLPVCSTFAEAHLTGAQWGQRCWPHHNAALW